MPYVDGACGMCRRLVLYHANQWDLPGSGDKKTLVRMLAQGQLACPTCGRPLQPEGTRLYEELTLAARATALRAAVEMTIAPTPRSRVAGLDLIETNIADNLAKRARDIAHEARQFSRELRFMFDTDRFGRPLN